MRFKMLFFFFAIFSALVNASEVYIIADGQSGVSIQEGGDLNADTRYSPNSSFKVPLALIGFDCGFLKDENTPVIHYTTEYEAFLESWKQDQTPASWMKNSCVWYSQRISEAVGMRKIKEYLASFDYGNQDMSGDVGKNNGLTNAWLSSSLKISPREQLEFLRKFANNELPVSAHSVEMTRKIIYLGKLGDGWDFYGKTGTGYRTDKSGIYIKDFLAAGFFIGFIEKGESRILIVVRLEFDKKQDSFPGAMAKERASQLLMALQQHQ